MEFEWYGFITNPNGQINVPLTRLFESCKAAIASEYGANDYIPHSLTPSEENDDASHSSATAEDDKDDHSAASGKQVEDADADAEDGAEDADDDAEDGTEDEEEEEESSTEDSSFEFEYKID